ncbi:putative sporulation protein YtxC [Schnuerera sp. xch1]|uniref:putative sporulation protein YtxC n=1 Tax=Schnuerera sp. xch1 TaxID=2874283 RepID=UPI001CC07355|nr:putative sporulation protein YtxC [Schnuerera sp. xch1]MBZ2175597.1 putative sporulation protein YtxC [Schnuerera sp. xch1]
MNIQVGLNKNVDEAREIIANYFSQKKIKVEEVDYDSRHFFNITPVKNKSVKDFYNKITNLILDLILNIYSEGIMNKQINDKFKQLQSVERKEIVNIAKKLLLNEDNFIVEKQYLNNQIKKYIIDKHLISIDGFITFRLKDLNLFLNVVIDKGIEEFTARKEYREFISILKYFIDAQNPKYELLNLVTKNDEYKLLDEEGNEIDKNFFDDISTEINVNNFSEDDILISALIVLAPQNLIIHLSDKSKDRDVIKIITDVFEDRVYFCLGCEKCEGNLKVKKS